MQIPLVTGSYKERSRHLNPSKCVNFYPVLDTTDQGNKYKISYYSGAGYKLYKNISGSVVRGLFSWDESAYVVVDNVFYVIASDNTITTVGTLSSSNGFIKMRANPTQLMIINKGSSEGYIYTFSTGVLSTISDPDYPGADDIDYQDGYFLVVRNGRLYFSAINDGTTWDGLDVVTPTYQADFARAVVSLKEDLILLGDKTTEIYYNNGVAPFERKPNHSLSYGTISSNSLLNIDESVIFMTNSYNGSGYVVRMSNNYEIKPISSQAIDYQISKFQTINDAFAISYKDGSHLFYQLTFPSEGRTFVYDITTDQWHERESLKSNNITISRHTANCQMFFNNQNIIGDYESGKLYFFDSSVYTENGRQIIGYVDSVPLNDDLKYLQISSFQVDMSTGNALATGQGDNPQLALQISKDNMPFGNERFMSSGKIGQYNRRVKYNRLGTARTWVFRVKYAEPNPMEILGVSAHGSSGAF